MTTVLLLLATFAAQRILVLPGLPPWPAAVLLPAVWITGPALRGRKLDPFLAGIGLGLAWDLMFEPVIGPGGIAWSLAAVAVWRLASLVADRSPLTWAGMGGVAAIVVILGRSAALVPLGMSSPPAPRFVLAGVLLTALWCGAVGLVLAADLEGLRRRIRTRKLR